MIEAFVEKKVQEALSKTNERAIKIDDTLSPKIDDTTAPQMQSNQMDYSKKTRDELIAICKEKSIKGYSNKKKEKIIQLLFSKPNMQHSHDILLKQIIAGKEIETVQLYEDLSKIQKTDHSNGVYYTPVDFFLNLLKKIDLSDIGHSTKTLDFCCGTGNLFLSYLNFLNTKSSHSIIKDIILNAVFIDIDVSAINIFKIKLYCWIKNNLTVKLDINDAFANFHINDALLDISILNTKFDIILSNPPFINLKSKTDYKKKIKDLNYYTHSINGMMDTYCVSIERILKLMEKDGHAIIICPSQILTNVSCFNLRKYILDSFSLLNVYKFSEKNTIFPSITQNICILNVKNNTKSTTIQYNICDYDREIIVNCTNDINISIYKKNDYNIISITKDDVDFLSKLISFPKFKSYQSEVKCARGNIDVTLDKEEIHEEKSPHPLVRGKNIKSLHTITEYISDKTIQNKNINITSKKLVCQQICNINSENRLSFTLVDSYFIISNSCNYITVKDEKYISMLKHILNSNILNRYFEIFSGNNHVSITEIQNLPLPNIFKNYIDMDNMTFEERKYKIYELYDLDKYFAHNYFNSDETIPITNSDETILITNHISQKLSKLEETMATYIKPGGNWTDIPTTLTTSKRLNKIRETGGRTTLYGRLEYSKPGFTITTQFARLPNSSNLHPTKNRMITIREAAILQSFPMDFKFNNTKFIAIKQIGNAVPPLLARFLANHIKNDIVNKNTLDLFSGVGGMSIGFSQEGFNIVLSNELDERLANEKENSKYHGSTIFICGDICDKKTKDKIKEKLKNTAIGVIIGGPPCQGFSLAGKRDSDDKRNKLYLDYFNMIEIYNPECFVMENVKGILSMKNKEKQLVIDEIKEIASKLGYKVSVFKLNACDFAVPQKRERVFVIGHKSKVFAQPEPLIKKNKHISVNDAIGFLESYKENTEFKIPLTIMNNPYIQYLCNIINLQELYRSYS
jgi:Alw26I/Eco31I/Esp3I family type II restriction m6 adenine DNA methyltransferase